MHLLGKYYTLEWVTPQLSSSLFTGSDGIIDIKDEPEIALEVESLNKIQQRFKKVNFQQDIKMFAQSKFLF